MDRKSNHTANKNKQSEYGKLYFIEHSSEYLNSHTELGPPVIVLNSIFKLGRNHAMN